MNFKKNKNKINKKKNYYKLIISIKNERTKLIFGP